MSRREGSVLGGVRARLNDRVVLAVAGVAVVALVARLVGLGVRVAHQDEARVGYWTLRFLVSGQWEYRPIVHGPFIPVVNRHLFGLLGPSDFVARLPMAVLGGSLPAAALLFRTRLRDTEVVALAALFAANPILLYYSRFMRQDVPLAVLAVVTLGFAVRAYDATGRRRRRYVYAAGLAFGLAATTKENVLLYPVAWAGALALILDQRLLAADDALARAREWVPDGPTPAVALPPGVRRGALLVFLGVSPPVAAVADLGGTALELFLLVGAVAFYGVVRGGTVWHLLGGLPGMTVGLLALVRPSYNTGLTVFVAGLAWILAGLLLVDEYAFEYDPAGGDARPEPTAVPDGGDRVEGDGSDSGDASDDGTNSDPGGEGGEPSEGALDTDGDSEAETDEGRLVDAVEGRLWPLPPLGVAYALALAVIVLFYAPRGGGYPAIGPDIEGWGLWSALSAGSPDGLFLVFREATYGTWTDFLGQWAGDAQDHAYLPFFEEFVTDLRTGALTLSLAAVGGTLYDRYGAEPRAFVSFCTYWGLASVLGYPLVTDIAAPWATVHAVVALAVPAAVALAAVYRVGREELRAVGEVGLPSPGVDWPTVAAVAIVLLGAGLQVGAAAHDTVYTNAESPDNELVQYAQSPSADLKPVLRDVRRAAERNDGVDVVYYDGDLDSTNESDHDQPPAGAGWFDRLPTAYYLELYSVRDGEIAIDSTDRREAVANASAPVVIAQGSGEADDSPEPAGEVAPLLSNHSRYDGYRFGSFGARSSVVYFVDLRAVEDPAGEYAVRADPAPALAPVD